MTSLRRILLVEDNQMDIDLTIAALEEYHLLNAIEVVRDGVEALDYLHARGHYQNLSTGLPAVVLLDIKMPKISGIEVLRQMKSDPNLAKVPVVMLTSSRAEPDLAECYALGVNAYVVKPVVFSDLVGAVKQIGAFWMLLNELPPGFDRPRRAL